MESEIIKYNNKNIQEYETPSLPALALKAKGISQSSKNTYYFNMISYEKFCKENNLSVGIDSAQKWVESSGTAKTSETRYWTIKRILKQLYGKTEKWGELEEELQNIKVKHSSNAKKRSDYFTKKEIDILCKNSPRKWDLFFRAAFETGARVSELANIKLKDCKVVKDDAVHVLLRDAKGGQEYTVFLNPATFKSIKEYFKGKVYLFETERGRAFARGVLFRATSQLCQSILGVRASPHTFRHSKAMYLKNDLGFSPDQVQKALHHKNVKTTLDNYYHGEPSAKDQGII